MPSQGLNVEALRERIDVCIADADALGLDTVAFLLAVAIKELEAISRGDQ
jgi:hypothetical protein